jgi:hypothetical protein
MTDTVLAVSESEATLVLATSEGRCTTIVFDLRRSRHQHLLRLARALELPPVDSRGRPATSWRTIQAGIEHRIARRDDEYKLRTNARHGLPHERMAELGAITELLADLVAAHVRFILVDETAAALHGSLNNPSALDILHDAQEPDARRALAMLLCRWRATPRGLESDQCSIDEHDLRAVPTLALTVRGQPVNLWERLETVGGFAEALKHGDDRAAFASLAFPVLGLPALIRECQASGQARRSEMCFQLEILELVRQQRLRSEAFRARLPNSPRRHQNA